MEEHERDVPGLVLDQHPCGARRRARAGAAGAPPPSPPTVTGSPAGASAIEPLSCRADRPPAAGGTAGRRPAPAAPACRAGARQAARSWARCRAGPRRARTAGRGWSAAGARHRGRQAGSRSPGPFAGGRAEPEQVSEGVADGWCGGRVSLYRPLRASPAAAQLPFRAAQDHGSRRRPYRGTGITASQVWLHVRHHPHQRGSRPRRRRTLFRAWHRGIREMDLIMGRFADAEIATCPRTSSTDSRP